MIEIVDDDYRPVPAGQSGSRALVTNLYNRTLPMIRLSHLFALEGRRRERVHAIVVGTGLAAIGIMVDRIAGQREIVVKTITDPLVRVDGVSGATELGDGRLVLILDVAALSRTVRARRTGEGVPA